MGGTDVLREPAFEPGAALEPAPVDVPIVGGGMRVLVAAASGLGVSLRYVKSPVAMAETAATTPMDT
jgi:hypothetical protein